MTPDGEEGGEAGRGWRLFLELASQPSQAGPCLVHLVLLELPKQPSSGTVSPEQTDHREKFLKAVCPNRAMFNF